LRRAARRRSRCPRQAVRPASVDAGAPLREKNRRQTRQGRKKVSVGCSQRRLLLLRSGGASCCSFLAASAAPAAGLQPSPPLPRGLQLSLLLLPGIAPARSACCLYAGASFLLMVNLLS
jgi:hypothetical protein